ncbi:MAG: hypothetical protein K6F39_03555 [Lachnospiraceae bacterium]|nr:hypothetical protein [Lachnospiraceae bacterium]
MIDFEAELKKFHPSLEIEDAEDAIYNHDVSDMMDLFLNMVNDKAGSSKKINNSKGTQTHEML